VFCDVSLDHFVLVLLAFVVLGLVSSVLSQDIGREARLRNDLFCVEWDVKPLLSQSVGPSNKDRQRYGDCPNPMTNPLYPPLESSEGAKAIN